MDSAQTIERGSDKYPRELLKLQRIPPRIFTLGETALLYRDCVSVIGSRNATKDGRKRSRKVSRILIDAGYVVMSGLAEGIDYEAHSEALRCSGRTIAVMGTGIDECYPVKHEQLKTEIARGNLVLTHVSAGEGGFALAQRLPDIGSVCKGVP